MKFIKTIFALALLATGMTCISCSSDDSENEDPNNPPIYNPEKSAKVVDLGLSVKWATCNLGANYPKEIGDYYAWGETSTKNEYSEANYFDSGYSIFTLNGNKSICGTNRDAAYVKLGKDWRMPTTAEITELINKCTWTDATVNGVKGRRGTASNGKSIFLPYTGMFAGTGIESPNIMGCYWGGELYADATRSNKYSSEISFFSQSEIHASSYYRWEGLAIRPVYIGTEFGNEDNLPSDDNENLETPPSDDIEDNLPSEAKLLVGYWSNSGSSREYCPNLYLSADGICFAIYQSMDNKWNYDYTWYTHVDQGYWTYDNSTKIFATSIGWQFNVTLSNEWAWAGIYKKGSKTYNQSLNKLPNIQVAQFLLNNLKYWQTDDKTTIDLSQYIITEDANENDYTFNYENGAEKGTVTIINPFYISKVSLRFKGSLNATLHRNWN